MRGLVRRAVVIIGAAAVLAGPAAGVASAGGAPVLGWSPTTSPGTYSYGTLNPGQAVSQVFTLANSGRSASATLKVTLTGSTAFTVTADSCTGTSLGPKKSCSVSVTYSPASFGETDAATLTAGSSKATASLALQGAAAKASPAISTSPGTGGPAGSTTVTDTATLSGGSSPGGMIEFRLYGPSTTASCTGTPVDDETVTASGDGSYTTPAGATPSQPGTYWWTASYSGDSSNNPAASTCGDESVTLTAAAHVYWTTVPQRENPIGTVGEANLNGSNPQNIVTGQDSPWEIAVNGSYIYWADVDSGTIMRANLDGTGVTTLETGQSFPTGVAIQGSHLYWADEGAGTIMEANLDGTGVQTLVTGQAGVEGLAVDSNHLYWAVNGIASVSIVEANLDGSSVTTLYTKNTPESFDFLWDVAVDGSHLYWTDEFAGTITEANLDGSNPQTIMSNQSGPSGITVYGSSIYWADQGGTIMRANLDGSNATALVSGLSFPVGVAVGP